MTIIDKNTPMDARSQERALANVRVIETTQWDPWSPSDCMRLAQLATDLAHDLQRALALIKTEVLNDT